MQYALNGFVLPGKTQKRGIWLLEATEYAPALSPRHADLYIPQVHYAVPLWGDPLSAVTLTLQVRIKGNDPTDLRNLWNQLIGLLGAGDQAPIALTRYRGTNTDTADGQLLSTTTPDFNCAANRLSVTILINIPGGGWRGPYIEQSVGEEPVDSVAGIQSTLPIADPLIRVQGSASFTSMEATDVNSGTGIRWSGPNVPAGRWLLVDSFNMRAVIKTTNDWNMTQFQTDVSRYLAFLGRGPLTITPRRTGASATPHAPISAIAALSPALPVYRARPMVA